MHRSLKDFYLDQLTVPIVTLSQLHLSQESLLFMEFNLAVADLQMLWLVPDIVQEAAVSAHIVGERVLQIIRAAQPEGD